MFIRNRYDLDGNIISSDNYTPQNSSALRVFLEEVYNKNFDKIKDKKQG